MIWFASLAIGVSLDQRLYRGLAGEPVDKAKGEVLKKRAPSGETMTGVAQEESPWQALNTPPPPPPPNAST